MTHLASELIAVTKLAFVADAYPYKDDKTIIVVLKPALREGLPLKKSVLTFQTDSFTEEAVVKAYEKEVVLFLSEMLRTAEFLLKNSVQHRINQIAPLCLN